MKRVAIGVMHPAPYRQPVLDRIASSGAFETEAFSNRAVDLGHAWAGFGEVKECLFRGNGIVVLFRAMAKYVFSRRYDLVCWSAYHPYWLTIPIVSMAILGKRYAVALDSVRDEGGGWFAHQIKGLIFRRACFLWVPGSASRRFLENGYGISSERIVEGVYALDDGWVRKCREERNVSSKVTTFLMVCNNVPHRKVDVVVDGFVRFARGRSDMRLVLCGKGMDAFAGNPHVEAVDGCPWSELPRLYARADVYVHNGSEQFSTAVLMASMAEIPIVVGREVGIARDLFGGEESPGICVDRWQSADAWAESFRMVVSASQKWRDFGRIGRCRARKFDVDSVAARFVSKAREVV